MKVQGLRMNLSQKNFWKSEVDKNEIIGSDRRFWLVVCVLDSLTKWSYEFSLQCLTSDIISKGQLKNINCTLLHRYEEITEQQKEVFLNEAADSWQVEAGKLLETLDTGAARSLLDKKNPASEDSCGNCRQADAKQRCSKCKKVRYCNRDCQAADWPRHRVRCSSSSTS